MLKDSFNRIHDYLRISLTDKCNLHCSYCNPVTAALKHLPHAKLMTAPEIETIASTFVKLGVKKIRLTGGEPLVRKDAAEIIRRLSVFPVELAITTNGVFVHQFIDTFKQASLQSVNVSLDSLNKEKCATVAGRNVFDRVWKNTCLLLDNGFHVKVNMVVMKGVNTDEILDFVELTRDLPLHIRFIEFMPFTGNRWDSRQVISYKEILQIISEEYDFIKLKDELHDTSKKFMVPGFKGTFAVISTMSLPFCGDCNRLRLTADGKMKNCLFSKSESDLLGALRRGEDIEPVIRKCVRDKKEVQGGQILTAYKKLDGMELKNRSMIHIGG